MSSLQRWTNFLQLHLLIPTLVDIYSGLWKLHEFFARFFQWCTYEDDSTWSMWQFLAVFHCNSTGWKSNALQARNFCLTFISMIQTQPLCLSELISELSDAGHERPTVFKNGLRINQTRGFLNIVLGTQISASLQSRRTAITEILQARKDPCHLLRRLVSMLIAVSTKAMFCISLILYRYESRSFLHVAQCDTIQRLIDNVDHWLDLVTRTPCDLDSGQAPVVLICLAHHHNYNYTGSIPGNKYLSNLSPPSADTL